MFRPLAWRGRLGATLLLVAVSASAQLSEKPESWGRLEGHYVADADADETAVLMLLARGVAQRAARTEGLRPATAELLRLAFSAYSAQNWNAATRLMTRALMLEAGRTPGEWLEVASSLQFQLDRRVARPGVMVHANLEPRFVLPGNLGAAYTVRLSLVDRSGVEVRELKKVKIEELRAVEVSIPTAGLAEGEYKVRYQLLDGEGKALLEVPRSLTLSAQLAERVRSLKEQSQKLGLAGVGRRSPRHAIAVQSVERIVELYERALREPVDGFQAHVLPILYRLGGFAPPYYSTDPIQPEKDLKAAESLAAALVGGDDALEKRRGELPLAYRSGVDETLRPFRVFVPQRYDAEKKWPLVVLLHGLGGDEGSYFERIGAVQQLAEERGYLLAAPSGLSAASSYSGSGAEDVFDVLDVVRQCYSVDDKQVFLSGHSVGGSGVISLALEARALEGGPRFAALAAVGGVPLTALEYAKAPAVPLLLIAGAKDRIFGTSEMRRMGFVLERRFKQFEYMELADEDESTLAGASLKTVFGFFDAVRKGEWKPSGKPIPVTPLAR